MSSRSYLIGTNLNTANPTDAEPGFDPATQILANDVEAVPLLWMALFREDDLREETLIDEDGDEITTFAPVAPVAKAIAQIKAALPYLNTTFSGEGPFDEYVEMIVNTVENSGFEYVTIDLCEIDDMLPPEAQFNEMLKKSLRGFDNPEGITHHTDDLIMQEPSIEGVHEMLADLTKQLGLSDEEDDDEEAPSIEELLSGMIDSSQRNVLDMPLDGEMVTIPGFDCNNHRDLLCEICMINDDVKLPSVRMYLDDLEYSDEEQWNFTRVIGAGKFGSLGIGRETPWEKEGADYGFEAIQYDEDEDYEDEFEEYEDDFEDDEEE